MPTGRLRADAQAFGRLTGWSYFPIAFAGRLPFAMMIVAMRMWPAGCITHSLMRRRWVLRAPISISWCAKVGIRPYAASSVLKAILAAIWDYPMTSPKRSFVQLAIMAKSLSAITGSRASSSCRGA